MNDEFFESEHRLRLRAHLRLAQAWCRACNALPDVQAAAAQALAGLTAAAGAAFAAADNAIAQEALQNVIVAASARETPSGHLVWMREAVDRLRQVFPYPGPESVEEIRTRFHDIENLEPALQVHANLRTALSLIADEATVLTKDKLALAMSEAESSGALDIPGIAAILDVAVSETQRDDTLARASMEKLPAEEAGLRFGRAVLVDDLDWQRAQIRHAVELATARFPIDLVSEASCVNDAIACIDSLRMEDGSVLLITDLGLPFKDGQEPTISGGAAVLDRLKTLPAELTRRITTIVASAQGRVGRQIETDYGTLLSEGPDGFIPKQHGWPAHLESSVRCLVTPPSIRESDLDVLAFSRRTALLDGIPLRFGPMGFAWLDALADPRPVPLPAGLGEAMPDQGYSPRAKTLTEAAVSVMLSALVSLPAETDEWWTDVREKGRDTYIGEYLNGETRKQLLALGVPWRGELVTSRATTDERLRKDVPSDGWEHVLTVRRVRRWTSHSEYLRHVRESENRVPEILVIDANRLHGEELLRGMRETRVGAIQWAPDVAAAEAQMNVLRSDFVVLVVARTKDLQLREEVIERIGSVPMVVLAPDNYPSTLETLQRRTSAGGVGARRGARDGLRSWVLGRVLDPILASGDPFADGLIVGERVLLLARAAARRRLRVRDDGVLHRLTVCRGSPRDFILDGRRSKLSATAKGTQRLLLFLAECECIELSAHTLIYALVEAGELDTGQLKTDFDQALDRHIGRLREGFATALQSDGIDAATAERGARDVLRGNNPYELWARVTVAEELAELDVGASYA